MSVAHDSRGWWFYRTVLAITSWCKSSEASTETGSSSHGKREEGGEELTLHTIALHLRHWATMSRAQLPALPL